MQYTKNPTKGSHPTKIPHAGEVSMEECIAQCLEGFRFCSELIPHCLSMGGDHAETHHIALLSACALACETSAKMMMLESEFHLRTCEICAEICRKCADDCEDIANGDRMMLQCAKVCRSCAKSCERMLN